MIFQISKRNLFVPSSDLAAGVECSKFAILVAAKVFRTFTSVTVSRRFCCVHFINFVCTCFDFHLELWLHNIFIHQIIKINSINFWLKKCRKFTSKFMGNFHKVSLHSFAHGIAWMLASLLWPLTVTGLIRSEKVRKNLNYLSKVRKSQKKSEKVREWPCLVRKKSENGILLAYIFLYTVSKLFSTSICCSYNEIFRPRRHDNNYEYC